MISVDEATARAFEMARPIGTETVPLEHSIGRLLSAPVVARIDAPRSALSAMDGYAVREVDWVEPGTRFRVIGESLPGQGFPGYVGTGEAVRVLTGAPIPDGADRVVVQESVRRIDGDIVVDVPRPPRRHIRARGSDFRRGETVLPAGTRLFPRVLVAAAAADRADVEVFRLPRVELVVTGDELVAPGRASQHRFAVPDSLSISIGALIERWGGAVTGRRRLVDDLPALRAAARDAVERADLVVVTGGASVGDRDFGKAMFGRRGLDLVFSGVAMKPGSPVWLGMAGECPVLGLPGNPGAALVAARLFLAPLLSGLAGDAPEEVVRTRRLPVAASLPAVAGRDILYRARTHPDGAQPLTDQDSGAQRVLAAADLLIRRRAHAEPVSAGTLVDVLDF